MMMAESTILKDLEIGKVDKQCKNFRTKVLEDHKANGIDQSLIKAIDDEQTIVFTDKSIFYVNIADYVANKPLKKHLKWVSIGRRNFVGTYYKYKEKILAIIFNCRYFAERIFDRLIITSITSSGY